MSLMTFFVSCTILFVSFLMFIFEGEFEVEMVFIPMILSSALLAITWGITTREYVILQTTTVNKEKIIFTHRNKEHKINIQEKYKNKKVNIIYHYSSFFDGGCYDMIEAE